MTQKTVPSNAKTESAVLPDRRRTPNGALLPMPLSLASSVGYVAARIAGKAWGDYAVLITNWPDIVGPDYAPHTLPVKITFPGGKQKNGDATLYIRVPGALAPELQHLAPALLQKINGFFGFPAVKMISFLHGGTTPRPKR
jgi:hypothetical protein